VSPVDLRWGEFHAGVATCDDALHRVPRATRERPRGWHRRQRSYSRSPRRRPARADRESGPGRPRARGGLLDEPVALRYEHRGDALGIPTAIARWLPLDASGCILGHADSKPPRSPHEPLDSAAEHSVPLSKGSRPVSRQARKIRWPAAGRRRLGRYTCEPDRRRHSCDCRRGVPCHGSGPTGATTAAVSVAAR
jgi:hypothetical protein